ncbi:MAG: carbon-nitrogen hydrolase family protein [Desulfofustis sp.]|nr:carbon-nitrogen hydrolase family protein [Desulfofustis sp.]
MTVKLALAQTAGSVSVQENIETAHRFIGQVAQSGADLIVFPEMFMALPQQGRPLGTVAETIDGPFAAALRESARENGVAVASGVWEKSDQEPDKAINAVIVFDDHGDLLASYRKIHLFNALSVRESDTMIGGRTPPPIFSLGTLRIGLAICYDLRFPELFRYLAGHGADLVIVPSAWYAGPMKEEHWLTLLQARAIENTCYVAGVNLCGGFFAARSAIFDPFGVPLAGAGEGETLLTASLSSERVREVREKLPTLTHARPQLFHE